MLGTFFRLPENQQHFQWRVTCQAFVCGLAKAPLLTAVKGGPFLNQVLSQPDCTFSLLGVPPFCSILCIVWWAYCPVVHGSQICKSVRIKEEHGKLGAHSRTGGQSPPSAPGPSPLGGVLDLFCENPVMRFSHPRLVIDARTAAHGAHQRACLG